MANLSDAQFEHFEVIFVSVNQFLFHLLDTAS